MNSLARWQLLTGGLFLCLAVLIRLPAIRAFDRLALLALHEHCSDGFSHFMLNLNAIAGPKPVYAVTALIAIFAYRSKGLPAAACVVGSMSISGILNLALRELFHRHRPELWRTLIYDHSFIWSFPSGHACLAASFGTVMTFLSRGTPYRAAAITFGIVYSLIVASTTLVLGVHNPTDILGGWISGWLITSLVWHVIESAKWRRKREVANIFDGSSVSK